MRATNRKSVDDLDRELQILESQLYSQDFSLVSNKEKVRKNVLTKVNRKEAIAMKKTISMKKISGIVAAALIGTALLSQTAFAKEIMENIVKMISLGNIEVVQYETPDIESYPFPQVLEGKLFDQEGKPVTTFDKEIEAVYTKDGEKIVDIDMNTGKLTTEKEEALYEANNTLIVKDKNLLNQYTCFEVKLPSYLPEGYVFDRAEFYKEADKEVKDSKYISLYFLNQATGESIYMQQRHADEETAYSIGTDEIVEEVQVSGIKAIMTGENSIDWEANGVLYGMSTQGKIDKEQLIKIAESIQ